MNFCNAYLSGNSSGQQKNLLTSVVLQLGHPLRIMIWTIFALLISLLPVTQEEKMVQGKMNFFSLRKVSNGSEMLL